jgi:hypothetical protein
VVLVTNHADAEIIPLLRAELERLGLQVALVDHGASEVVPRDLSRAAREQQAVAGFRVLVSQGTVEMWIADRVTGKVTLREVLAREGESKVSETVVVTRAVELLRASLMEIEAPHELRGEVPAPPELVRLASYPRPPARAGLFLGVGLFFSPSSGQENTLLGSAGASLRVAPWDTVSLGASARFPTASQQIDAAGGSTSVSVRWYALDVRHESLFFSDRLHLSYGPGLALLDASSHGAPSGGFRGSDLRVHSPAPHLAASVGVFLGPTLRITTELMAGASLRPLSFSLDGQRIGQVGPWVGSATVGLTILFR